MIKFRLEKWEKALVFQVLEQDPNVNFEFKTTTSGGEVVIRKNSKPQLLAGVYYKNASSIFVYVRGKDDALDFHPSVCLFKSNADRDKAFSSIIEAFIEFKKQRSTKLNGVYGIYEF